MEKKVGANGKYCISKFIELEYQKCKTPFADIDNPNKQVYSTEKAVIRKDCILIVTQDSDSDKINIQTTTGQTFTVKGSIEDIYNQIHE